MVFFLYLSMRQLEPYHMAVSPFDPSNRNVVVMHVDDSFFTTMKSRLIASMSSMSTSAFYYQIVSIRVFEHCT